VGAGGGDLQGALGGRLAADVGEVHRIRNPFRHKGVQVHASGGDRLVSLEVSADLREGPGASHLQILNDRGFGQIVRR
jgi:hypothetical protein